MQKFLFPWSLSVKFLQRKKKINKWYQSQSVNTLNFSKTNLSLLKNQRMVPISIPTKFTQSVNRKYTIRELGFQFSHR